MALNHVKTSLCQYPQPLKEVSILRMIQELLPLRQKPSRTTFVTNKIGKPDLPTEYTVMHQVSGNPATHDEVVDAAHAAEEHLIPAFVTACGNITRA